MRSQQGETDLWSQEGGAPARRAQKEKPEIRSQKEDIRNEEARRRGQTCGQEGEATNGKLKKRKQEGGAKKEKSGIKSLEGLIMNEEPRRRNQE